jgi:hypothetical protein
LTDDDILRRKLLRSYLGELAAMCAVAGFVGALVYNLLHFAIVRGVLVLNAGRRSGPVVPVEITWNEAPVAFVGVVCLSLFFFGAVASLTASPVYHVLRTGFPNLQLPRVPRSETLRAAKRLYFSGLALVALLGTGLVLAQYLGAAP